MPPMVASRGRAAREQEEQRHADVVDDEMEEVHLVAGDGGVLRMDEPAVGVGREVGVDQRSGRPDKQEDAVFKEEIDDSGDAGTLGRFMRHERVSSGFTVG